jgi:hypothetical protein
MRKLAVLTALLALAATQALAPASAGAVMNQSTTCLNVPIPGVGSVPGMGVATGSDGQKYACVLDSAGEYYGGTDKKKDSTPTTSTTPDCTFRSCSPHRIGGGAGSGSGSREARGPRPGGPAVKPKSAGGSPGEKPNPDECLELGLTAMIGYDQVRNAHKAELRKTMNGLQFRREQTGDLARQERRPKLRKSYDDASQELGRKIAKLEGQIRQIDDALKKWGDGDCSRTLYGLPGF